MYAIADLWQSYRPLSHDDVRGYVQITGPLEFADSIAEVLLVPKSLRRSDRPDYMQPFVTVQYDGHSYRGRATFPPQCGYDLRPAWARLAAGLQLTTHPTLVEAELDVPLPIDPRVLVMLLQRHLALLIDVKSAATPLSELIDRAAA